MEYTNRESFLKRFLNKIKNSAIGSMFSSDIDVPSDNELYNKITSEEGLSLKEAKEIEKAFKQAKESAVLNYTSPEQEEESKFRVKGINPKANVENLPRAKGGREHGEREL